MTADQLETERVKLVRDTLLAGWKQGMTDAGEICDALVSNALVNVTKYELGPAIRRARDARDDLNHHEPGAC